MSQWNVRPYYHLWLKLTEAAIRRRTKMKKRDSYSRTEGVYELMCLA